MRICILLLFLSMHLSINSNKIITYAKKVHKTVRIDNYNENYLKTIEYLKVNEGFSPVVYDDNGYKAQGYGQRLAFYLEKIPSIITRYEAEIILKKSFGNHMKMVKNLFPKLNKNKKLALSHMSYTIGIGRVMQLMDNNQIDSVRLLIIGKKEIREFELKLYNNYEK